MLLPERFRNGLNNTKSEKGLHGEGGVTTEIHSSRRVEKWRMLKYEGQQDGIGFSHFRASWNFDFPHGMGFEVG